MLLGGLVALWPTHNTTSHIIVPGTDLEFLLWKSFRHPIINLSTSIYSDKLTVHAAGRELQFTAGI
jgi:hypothetical protein